MTFFLLVRMLYHWATLDIIKLAAMVAPYEHFNFANVVPKQS